jgi:hypothetical protein
MSSPTPPKNHLSLLYPPSTHVLAARRAAGPPAAPTRPRPLLVARTRPPRPPPSPAGVARGPRPWRGPAQCARPPAPSRCGSRPRPRRRRPSRGHPRRGLGTRAPGSAPPSPRGGAPAPGARVRPSRGAAWRVRPCAASPGATPARGQGDPTHCAHGHGAPSSAPLGSTRSPNLAHDPTPLRPSLWRARPRPGPGVPPAPARSPGVEQRPRLARPCSWHAARRGAAPLLARSDSTPLLAWSGSAPLPACGAQRSVACARLGPGAARSRRVSAALRALVLAWCARRLGAVRRAPGATHSARPRVTCPSTPPPPCILCALIMLFILMKLNST